MNGNVIPRIAAIRAFSSSSPSTRIEPHNHAAVERNDLRIKGGTARHDEPSLCLSCRYATVVKGVSLRQEIIECRRLSDPHNRITFPVTFCSAHIDQSHPTIQEMEETAWILRSDPKRSQMGFVKASDLKPKDRYVLPDEWL